MRSIYGVGKPKAAHDRAGDFIFAILAIQIALELALMSELSLFGDCGDVNLVSGTRHGILSPRQNWAV